MLQLKRCKTLKGFLTLLSKFKYFHHHHHLLRRLQLCYQKDYNHSKGEDKEKGKKKEFDWNSLPPPASDNSQPWPTRVVVMVGQQATGSPDWSRYRRTESSRHWRRPVLSGAARPVSGGRIWRQRTRKPGPSPGLLPRRRGNSPRLPAGEGGARWGVWSHCSRRRFCGRWRTLLVPLAGSKGRKRSRACTCAGGTCRLHRGCCRSCETKPYPVLQNPSNKLWDLLCFLLCKIFFP